MIPVPSADAEFVAAVRTACRAISSGHPEPIAAIGDQLVARYPHAALVEREAWVGYGRETIWYAFRDGRGAPRGRRRVLVVDDDVALTDVIVDAIDGDRFEVRAVHDGAAALGVLGDWPPDLILLDLQMSTMDGATFARRYGELPPPHAPLLVVTGARDADTRLVGLDVRSVIAKPFALDDLTRLVDRYA